MQKGSRNLGIKCRIEGCDREAMYKEKALCQKHYFRIMRNGHERLLVSKPNEKGLRNAAARLITPNGYVKIHSFNHPLARNHYVFEHRFIMYKKYGDKLPPCECCGKEIDWNNSHIDHIDKNKLNNVEENLRPLCRGCNTKRTERSTIPRFEYQGKMMTLTQLAKLDGVTVGRHQVKIRLDSGMSLEDALFMPKITHKQTKKDIYKEG